MTAPRATVEYEQDAAGKWRWHITVPGQGSPRRVLADSGQGYTRRTDAKRAYRRVEALVTAGQVVEVES